MENLNLIQDELEDVYQHLRLTFSTWLSRSGADGKGGSEFRERIESILKRYDLPVFEKRKRLDIMLESRITQWLEPSDENDESNTTIKETIKRFKIEGYPTVKMMIKDKQYEFDAKISLNSLKQFVEDTTAAE